MNYESKDKIKISKDIYQYIPFGKLYIYEKQV